MDRDQQDLKSIGFWGILKKTFKIIYKERLIFTKITLSFILPLTIILPIGYYVYIFIKTMPLPLFLALFLAGIFMMKFFFLLPTSAIIFTIARIYTTKQFTFKTIFLSVFPKAWLRLMVIFAIQFLIMLAYHFVTILLLVPPIIWLGTAEWPGYTLPTLAILYLIGLVYFCVIWNLAEVVTLLEDLKGYGAIKKSKALLKGKRLVTSSLFLLISISVFAGQIAVFLVVCIEIVDEEYGYGVCLLLTLGLILSVVVLLGLVIPTIFYFVYKSYHQEIVDKSYLELHLDNFLPAAYVPPVEINVQPEHSNF